MANGEVLGPPKKTTGGEDLVITTSPLSLFSGCFGGFFKILPIQNLSRAPTFHLEETWSLKKNHKIIQHLDPTKNLRRNGNSTKQDSQIALKTRQLKTMTHNHPLTAVFRTWKLDGFLRWSFWNGPLF